MERDADRSREGHLGRAAGERAIAWGFVAGQFALLAAALLLPAGDDWRTPEVVDRVARTVGLAGLAVLVIAAVGLGRALTPLPTPAAHGRLRTGGLYRRVRHPIYGGLMAVALGSAVPSGSTARVAAALGLIAWLAVKARWEERLLRARYPGYATYAARTPRFVPGWPFGADRR